MFQCCKWEISGYVPAVFQNMNMSRKSFLPNWLGAIAASIIAISALPAQESYIVLERHSGRVLLANASEQKRPVASLTKMATAKVVLDWAKATQTNMATMLVVPPSVAAVGGSNPLQLAVGDQISLRDALYSSLLGSDNIAALTLAHFVGGNILFHRQQNGDPVVAFVAEMNQLAGALGMRQTRFGSPHGLDADNRRAFSTASDMMRLSMKVVQDPSFTFFTKQKERALTVVKASGGSMKVVVRNTNKLLGANGMRVIGLKTGTTQLAGECLALAVEKNAYKEDLPGGAIRATPVEMLVVLLGSQQRDARARQLVSQGWGAYEQWRTMGYPASPERREFIQLPVPQ